MAFLANPFGSRLRQYESHTFQFPIATTAIDQWLWTHPGNSMSYELVGVTGDWAVVAGQAAGLALRKVTAEATAPSAAAGATVIEMLSADFDFTTTANTKVQASLIASASSRSFVAGNKLGANFTGTTTSLVGAIIVVTFRIKPY
jgi:hypothetical protein